MTVDPAFKNLPTNQEYNLMCKVKVIRQTGRDWANKAIDTKSVLLIPDTAHSETHKFLIAWLPEAEDKSYEIGMYIAHPVHSPARGAIRRKNKDCPDYHNIFVMDLGAENDLVKMDGKKVEVKILPESITDDPDNPV
jgi:hypothetical protein